MDRVIREGQGYPGRMEDEECGRGTRTNALEQALDGSIHEWPE